MREFDNILIKDLPILLNEDTTLKKYYGLINIREQLIETLLAYGICDKYAFFNYSEKEKLSQGIISVEDLEKLCAFLHLHDFKERKLSEVGGIDTGFINVLSDSGIRKSSEYMKTCIDMGLVKVALVYGTTETEAEHLMHLCDLMRLPGVKDTRANLYFNCGYISFNEFAASDAEEMQHDIAQKIKENGWNVSTPLLKEIKTQIAVSRVLPKII